MTAPPTNTYETYAAVGNREDLSDIIYNIDPFDTPGINSFGDTTSDAVLHSWQLDSLTAASRTNVVEEGLDSVTTAVVPTVRKSNTCQISKKTPRVSGTQQAVNKAGRGDELEYQVAKMAKELKRDIETMIFDNNAEVTGSSGTPREHGGIPTWLTSNQSGGVGAVASTGSGDNARTPGTTREFTETLLQEMLRTTWNNGGDPDKIHVGGTQKQNMSKFTGNATRMIGAEDKELVAAIDVYRSDFGDLQIVPNRFSDGSNSNNGTAFILQSDMWKLAYLRPYQISDLAKTGDSERKDILVEYTLEACNEKSSAAIYDLAQS
jgi:hypothetical protein